MTELQPPIFVVGCFRGGTTLLERVLLRHPDVTGPGFETQLFSRVRYGRALDHSAEYEAFTAGIHAIGDAVAEFAAAANAQARRESARRWVEKSPEHVYHARAILHRFPGARIVHVVRDPRAVVTSVLHTPWAVPRARGRHARMVAGAVLWELMTREGLRLLSDSALSSSVFGVRYETLVEMPAAELQRVAAFIGLPDDSESVDAWMKSTRDVEANSLIEPGLRGIGTSPVGRWRDSRNLTAREVALVQFLVAPTLVRAGYELEETEPLPLGARARAASAKAAWLAIRAQRYAKAIGRGAPPHFAADVHATMLPLLRAEATNR